LPFPPRTTTRTIWPEALRFGLFAMM
jgi:hypothetical protein